MYRAYLNMNFKKEVNFLLCFYLLIYFLNKHKENLYPTMPDATMKGFLVSLEQTRILHVYIKAAVAALHVWCSFKTWNQCFTDALIFEYQHDTVRKTLIWLYGTEAAAMFSVYYCTGSHPWCLYWGRAPILTPSFDVEREKRAWLQGLSPG